MANVTYKEISDLVLEELHTSLGAIKEEEVVEQLIDIVLSFRKELNMKSLWQYHANLE